LGERLAGVVTLSTPFLHSNRRFLLPAVFLTPLVIVILWHVVWGVNFDLPGLTMLAVFLGLLFLLIFYTEVEGLVSYFTFPTRYPNKFLIIRTPGDEAHAALVAAQFFS
jgi:hypothetical protein